MVLKVGSVALLQNKSNKCIYAFAAGDSTSGAGGF